MQGGATAVPPLPCRRCQPAHTHARRIWNRERAVGSLGRAYNYPHQTAVYWSMYRLAKFNDRVRSAQAPAWYLRKAYDTIAGMWSVARWYTQVSCRQGARQGRAAREESWAWLDCPAINTACPPCLHGIDRWGSWLAPSFARCWQT